MGFPRRRREGGDGNRTLDRLHEEHRPRHAVPGAEDVGDEGFRVEGVGGVEGDYALVVLLCERGVEGRAFWSPGMIM